MIGRLAAAGVALATLLALGGCATPAEQANMAAPAVQSGKKLPYTVRVETRGGADTGLTDMSNISDAELKSAIETSIRQSGLFRSVVADGGDYVLSVSVAGMQRPLFGGAVTVTLDMGWSLMRAGDRSVVLRKGIRTSYTAQMSHSLVGITRMRLAVEGAVRQNISEGLQAIAEQAL
ncbi:MAG TPA: hypothetical protein VIL30_23735 [Ramlibacter sp.]